MYTPKDYIPPNPNISLREKQERRRKSIGNQLHQQIVRRNEVSVGQNRVVVAMIDWYESSDEQTKDIILDQVIKLMDMLDLRSAFLGCNKNFGPLSALELLGVALAVDQGWIRHPS